ncbi:MAG: acyl-CoA reductase [Flavobacteriales bacterium]|nr:acyl-CoA reductase [Flavobacteriales bacterium]
MELEKRINAFSKLGMFLGQFVHGIAEQELSEINARFYDDFNALIDRQRAFNAWFDRESVLKAIGAISGQLTPEKLNAWLAPYSLPEGHKTIGVIMAGNIPLVGFHDYLSVLIAGHKLQAKLSAEDGTLLKKVSEVLMEMEPAFQDRIQFVERLSRFDAVIATGSNNTARYFNQYFGKYPHIIRKNRNSVAVIHADDEVEDIKKLAPDVFDYYGLGCRNVSKLYLPENFPVNRIFEAFYDWSDVVENNKYVNNYEYNKAVYLMGSNQLLDNNFVLLKEDSGLSSPVGVLHYEYYRSLNELKQHLASLKDDLQCIVSGDKHADGYLNFGEAQCPALSDYADGVDTIAFLSAL